MFEGIKRKIKFAKIGIKVAGVIFVLIIILNIFFIVKIFSMQNKIDKLENDIKHLGNHIISLD